MMFLLIVFIEKKIKIKNFSIIYLLKIFFYLFFNIKKKFNKQYFYNLNPEFEFI